MPCTAITAIAMSFVPNVSSEIILCILLLIAGISSAIYHIPAPVMVRHLSGNKIGRGMSFFMLGGELARTTGPIIILSAIGYFGVEGSYKVLFIGLIVSVYLFFKILKYITIRGLFEDPSALGDFINCSGKPCWSPYDIYPLNQWMWTYIKPQIVQQLMQKETV